MAHAMTAAQRSMELGLLEAEALGVSSSDLYARMDRAGLPSEVSIRLKEVAAWTRRVGDTSIAVGRIVVIKLIEFIEAHPNLVAGMALAAGVSALLSMVPLLGPLLGGVALMLGLPLAAIVGHRMDKQVAIPKREDDLAFAITRDLIEIARAFLRLVAEVLGEVMQEVAR